MPSRFRGFRPQKATLQIIIDYMPSRADATAHANDDVGMRGWGRRPTGLRRGPPAGNTAHFARWTLFEGKARLGFDFDARFDFARLIGGT